MESQKKILVTGSNGQLGNELRVLLGDRAVYVDRDDLDLTDRGAVERFMQTGDFSYVVNCAAYTAVDRAEEEKMACNRANKDIVENLARCAEELDYRIIHISTDYVFDGRTSRPYNEGDKPEPLSVYGTSKRIGFRSGAPHRMALFIIRQEFRQDRIKSRTCRQAAVRSGGRCFGQP